METLKILHEPLQDPALATAISNSALKAKFIELELASLNALEGKASTLVAQLKK